jgi:hypothetical protein
MEISPILVPITLFVCIAVGAIGVANARADARRMESEPATRELPPDGSARLERMEQALYSIALEVERISEGQRFTTKLLAERNSGGSSGVSEAPAPRERS